MSRRVTFVGLAAICSLALVVLTILFFDRLLGLLDYPATEPVTASPGYVQQYRNLEYEYEIRANDRGIRYESIPLEKPLGSRRIVVLGDSMTEGTGVDDADRWTNVLEDRFTRRRDRVVRFINVGEAGKAVFHYGRKLFHVGLDYQPDAVLLALYFNDFSANSALYDPDGMFPGVLPTRGTALRSVLYRLFPRVYLLARDAILAQRQAAEDGLAEAARLEADRRGIPMKRFERWRSALPQELEEAADAGLIAPVVLTYALTRPEYFSAAFNQNTAAARLRAEGNFRLLDRIRFELDKRGIPLLVTLLPSVFQYDPHAAERPQAKLYAAMGHPLQEEWAFRPTELERIVASWADRAEIPFLDATPAFRDRVQNVGGDEPLNFAIDNHWTPAGHLAAAEIIGDWLATSDEVSFLRD